MPLKSQEHFVVPEVVPFQLRFYRPTMDRRKHAVHYWRVPLLKPEGETFHSMQLISVGWVEIEKILEETENNVFPKNNF